MKMRLNGQELVIFWKHNEAVDAKLWNRSTTCSIALHVPNRDKDSKEPIQILQAATAFCSKKDQYNYNTGRKESLAKAIKGYTREDRQQFWRTYFTQIGNKKRTKNVASDIMKQMIEENPDANK